MTINYHDIINGITINLASTARDYNGLHVEPDMLYGRDAYGYYMTYGETTRAGRMIIWRATPGINHGRSYETTDGTHIAAAVRRARLILRSSAGYNRFSQTITDQEAHNIARAACRAYRF